MFKQLTNKNYLGVLFEKINAHCAQVYNVYSKVQHKTGIIKVHDGINGITTQTKRQVSVIKLLFCLQLESKTKNFS